MSEKAWQLLVEAAQQGDGFAITLVGLQLINTQANVELGKGLIFEAADLKNVIWAKHLASYIRQSDYLRLPLQNQITLDDYALVQLIKYISEGDSWAMLALGDMYFNGYSVPCDRKQGEMLLSCARILNIAWMSKNLCAHELVEEYGFKPDDDLIKRYRFLDEYKAKYKAFRYQ